MLVGKCTLLDAVWTHVIGRQINCVQNCLSAVIVRPTGDDPHCMLYPNSLNKDLLWFRVFTALMIKITVFWDMKTYWLVICYHTGRWWWGWPEVKW